jgi:chromate transporter
MQSLADHKVHAMQRPVPRLGEASALWARIGLLSFGGPAGQIALLQRLVVDEKRWIGEKQFLHALSFCMLLPGPEAQQLATYCGWLLNGWRGGVIAGALFYLPGLALILLLSALYVSFGETQWLAAIFFGLKCAVLAIVAEALLRVSKRALKRRAEIFIALLAFLALFIFNLPFPLVILAAGIAGYFARSARPPSDMHRDAPAQTPRTLGTILLWAALWALPLLPILVFGGGVFLAIWIFFSQLAVVSFGGAYAVLAYVAQAAAGELGWLLPGEMVDGLALAETTPGPLVLVLSFVGFLAAHRHALGLDPMVAGLLGGMLAAWATFVPSFLFVLTAAPFVERLRRNAALSGALNAVTAAVVGVIANLALWFALHVLFGATGRLEAWPVSMPWPDWTTLDWRAVALTLAAGAALFGTRLGIPPVLAMSAALGAAFYFLA